MNWFDTKLKKIGAGASAMVLLLAVGSLIANDTRTAPRSTPVTVVNATPVPVSQQRSVKAPLPLNQPHHAPAPATEASSLNSGFGKLPLAFEINQGQTSGQVKFLSRGRGYTLFLTGDEAVLTLKAAQEIGSPKPTVEDSRPASTLRMKLLGANAGATVTGTDELPGRSNYFIGNDPKKWRADVPNYAKVRYQDVYPGVDLVYYGNQSGHLEYDFIVAPGADPNVVRLDVAADTVRPAKDQRRNSSRIAANGDLVVKTDGGEVRFQKPVVYQEQFATRQSIDGRYVVRGKHGIGFEVASYDHSKALIIDPVLSYSTYLGGNSNDQGYGIAVDSAGNAYVTGVTNSTNFPTANAYQPAQGTFGVTTVFVTKMNASGTALVYSTYLGGGDGTSRLDWAQAIAVDSAGSAYVTGFTQNLNFPIFNAFQTNLVGAAENAFVTKLSAAGNALVYSTYLGGTGFGGGTGADRGYGIAVDSAGNAYITGYAQSRDFPTASPIQAFNSSPLKSLNAFVTKLNTTGNTLVYSTYLGGSTNDFGNAIAVDSAGNAYVTGQAFSADFPTANAIQAICGSCGLGGSGNAFVTKLNAAGSALAYSTYLGGNFADQGRGIAVDSAGSAYVTGSASSANFPTVNPIQGTFGGYEDAFVTKLNATGSALVYSTYLGGYYNDVGFAIQVDAAGNAYVAGQTLSPNFPTANPIQLSGGVFVSSLNADGSAFLYSTHLGGSQIELAQAVAIDSTGSAYVTGSTNSTDFTTVNPFQPNRDPGNSSTTAFVAKIGAPGASPSVNLSATSLMFGPQNVSSTSASQTEMVTNTGTGDLTISAVGIGGTNAGDFAKSSDACTGATVPAAGTCTVGVTFTPTAAGGRNASLSFTDNAGGSPQQVTLSGTGIAATSTIVTAPPITYGATANVTVAVTSGQGTVTGNVSLSVDSGAPLSQALSSGSSVFHENGLSAGSHSLSGSFSAQGIFAASSGSGTLVVNKATPAISINDIPSNAAYGGSFTPTFAYSGDGSTSASSSTAATCTAAGAVVNFVGAGTCTLTAHGSAGTNYLAIDGTPQSFTIAQLKPAISINNLPDAPRFGGSFTPLYNYLGDGVTSVTSGTTGTCTVSGAVVDFTGAGTCTLTAHATATANSAAATGSPQSFAIGQADPTISINDIPGTPIYGGSFTPKYAYAGNGKTSTTSSTSSTCTVSTKGGVSFIAAGTCSLTAHATATTDYAAATGPLQSITIAKATTTISIKNIPRSPSHGGSFTPTYSYVGDGSPSASSSTPTTCSVTGGVVNFLAAGSCILTAQATAGPDYAATTGVAQTVTVK